MYEDQTYEVILQRMLNNLSDEIDKREGSVAYDMLAPKAAELAMAYMELDNVLNIGFAETTYGEYLNRKVAEIGMTREQAIKAKGSITFNGPNGTVIPQGSVVYTDSGVRFLTDAEVTITNGAATVTITAEEGGNAGNVPANSIINNEIAEVTCTNPQPTSDGVDTETDEQLIIRYLEQVRRPATSGNVYHYQQWTKEVIGIGDARVVPIWNGPGTVKVIVIGEDKRPVSQSKVDEVFNYIETVRPVGAEVTVESAQGVTIDVSATLVLDEDYNLAQVQPIIQQKITDYFESIAFVESSVKYSRIGLLLLDTEGVLDYSNLTVNGGTSNISIGFNQVPVLGTVSLG
jgi:uncharacterized phage protein gp47/JayE